MADSWQEEIRRGLWKGKARQDFHNTVFSDTSLTFNIEKAIWWPKSAQNGNIQPASEKKSFSPKPPVIYYNIYHRISSSYLLGAYK